MDGREGAVDGREGSVDGRNMKSKIQLSGSRSSGVSGEKRARDEPDTSTINSKWLM